MTEYERGRKDLVDEIIEYLEEEIDDYKNCDEHQGANALSSALHYVKNLVKE